MNVGIIGAGFIAGLMANTLNGMSDAVLYAVAARDLDRANDFAKIYGAEKAYGSYEELVKDDAVDLVYIATPHSHHRDHAMLCISHGKPILCEKAFTQNAQEAKEIIAFAREKKVYCAEAIWTRYMPSRTILTDLIKDGRIGKVESLTCNLGYNLRHIHRLQAPELAGGALLDLGVYIINFTDMIFGLDAKEVISTCTKFESGVDMADSIILKYEDDKIASIQCTAVAGTDQYGIIYGSDGYIIAKNINNINVIEIYTKNRELVAKIDVPEQITGYEYQVHTAIECIREGKLECEQAPHAKTIEIMEFMDKLRADWGVVYPGEK